MTKFQYQTFFASEDIKLFIISTFCLDTRQYHKHSDLSLCVSPVNSAMDTDKRKEKRKVQKLEYLKNKELLQ